MCELLMPKIEETAKMDEGRIIILSSAAASFCSGINLSKCPVPEEEYHEWGDYCVSKAIDSFHARYLQKKYHGKNIFTCAVHPGLIDTPLLDHSEGYGSLLFKSLTMAPFRKDILQGSATTLYCALSPDIPKHINDGYFFFFNCGPQHAKGVAKVGVADHFVDDCEARQLELVKPFM